MRNIMKLIPIILSLFLLCACSPIRDCHVVDKEYEPPHSRVVIIPNANGGMHIVPQHVPEEYILIIEGKNEKGRVKRMSISVSKETYETYERGDEWGSEM